MSNLLDLTKSLELNLTKQDIVDIPQMAVKLAVDRSGSMSEEYSCGWVQNAIDLMLAAAVKFDDDGQLEIGFFNTQFIETKPVTVNSLGTYLKETAIDVYGGTKFSEAISTLLNITDEDAIPTPNATVGFFKRLFSKKVEEPTKDEFKAAELQYLAVITDGDNYDKQETSQVLNSLTDNQFVQFIAIGTEVNADYLDLLSSRYNNVSVIYLKNPKTVSNDTFFEAVVNDKFKHFIKGES